MCATHRLRLAAILVSGNNLFFLTNVIGARPCLQDPLSNSPKLRDTKPEDFASEYDSMQLDAHKDALFERYANGGEDSNLKDWASKSLPALKHYLETAQASDKNRK